MKKQILNLGKGLSKAEQRVIHGGYEALCTDECGSKVPEECASGYTCTAFSADESCQYNQVRLCMEGTN